MKLWIKKRENFEGKFLCPILYCVFYKLMTLTAAVFGDISVYSINICPKSHIIWRRMDGWIWVVSRGKQGSQVYWACFQTCCLNTWLEVEENYDNRSEVCFSLKSMNFSCCSNMLLISTRKIMWSLRQPDFGSRIQFGVWM